jgi:N-acetylmuramoyl-L-alanine amidase CwlA
MSYPIEQNFIPGLPKNPYRHGIGAYEGVVDHSTDTPEATDEAERNYEAGHWQNAFVQFFVDWDSITQVADTDYTAWGAGPNANPRFVHIELCETSDPAKFKASYDRYIWLSAWILSRKNLGVVDGVTLWSHAEVTKNLGGTTHTDPVAYLESHGVTWAQHVANVKAMYDSFFTTPATAPQPAATSTTTQEGTLLKVITKDLWYYDKPDWNAKKDLVHMNDVFTVVDSLMVNGSKMYRLKSGNYITANPAYVQVTGLAPQPQPQPVVQQAPTGIKSVGKIKIVGVRVAAFICDKPSQNSNNLGTATLGSVLPISGSVPGWWEVIYNGRRAYVNSKYGVKV